MGSRYMTVGLKGPRDLQEATLLATLSGLCVSSYALEHERGILL